MVDIILVIKQLGVSGFSKVIIADYRVSTQFIEANTTEEPQRSQ